METTKVNFLFIYTETLNKKRAYTFSFQYHMEEN
jgi:hypothetical protein